MWWLNKSSELDDVKQTYHFVDIGINKNVLQLMFI